MDTNHLIGADLDPHARFAIGNYLAELADHLPVGRRTRREIVAEIADGLICAVTDRAGRGENPADAVTAALTELGDPRALATAFTRQLGPVAAHRLGAGLVMTGPLVGLTWVAAYATAGLGWHAQIGAVFAELPQLLLILAVTVPAAMIAITGAGWAARHLAVPSRLVTGAALTAAIGCISVDLSLLWAAASGHTPAATTSPVVLLAAGASVLRLSVAAWSGRRVLHLRSALN